MRFRITGFWKRSAEPAAITVAADTEQQARDYAASTGVIVVEISPGQHQPACFHPPCETRQPHPLPTTRPPAPSPR